MVRNWNEAQTISVDQGKKCYLTRDLVFMFTDLLDQGYSALSLGLIVDLIDQKLEESETEKFS